MTEAETEPPIFEYAVLSGTRNHVGERLTAAGKEGWLLNGMSTCVLAPGDYSGNAQSSIVMTCVIMRQAPAEPEPDQSGKGGSDGT